MKKRQRTPQRARKGTKKTTTKRRPPRPRRAVSAVASEVVFMAPAIKLPKVTAAVRNPALADDGSELNHRTNQWVCRYHCIGFKRYTDGVMFHHRDCPYWQREGRNKTPF